MNEADLADRAAQEEVEIAIGASHDVQTRFVTQEVVIDPRKAATIPLLPGVASLRIAHEDFASQLTVTNARDVPIDFELRLQLADGTHVTRADHPVSSHEGHPVIALYIPAHHSQTLSFVMERAVTRATRVGQ